MTQIKIIHMYVKPQLGPKDIIVNTCSNAATGWERQFSPFILGPCDVYQFDNPIGGEHRASYDPERKMFVAQIFENLWQFAKVYPEMYKDDKPTDIYWMWARGGWGDTKAHRYPMGKGRKPLGSLWKGQMLGYIDARKQIYAPIYAKLVQKQESFTKLMEMYKSGEYDIIYLRDWDGYDHGKLGLSLTEVLNKPDRKMGHAFVLKALITDDPVLKEYKNFTQYSIESVD